jgi:DNA-binding CsgD family transcriptional regulator
MTDGRFSLESRDGVISLMYEAAANPQLWPVALDALAKGARARGANLEVYDRQASDFWGFMGGVVPNFLLYREYYHRLDPLNTATPALPVGERVTLCHESVSPGTVAKSEFYQDFLIPNHGRYRADWHLENTPDRRVTLGLFTDKIRFQRSELSAWEPVAFHARQAIRLMANIGPLLARGEMLRQAIDHKQMACIMVDANARVLDCSAAALPLLESGAVLQLRHRSQLAAVSKEETARLHILIEGAATGRRGAAMRLSGQWLLQLVPSGVAQQNPFDPRFTHCALVFVTPPRSPTSPGWKEIQQVLDCTPAEAQVAAALVSGITPREIAARRHVSLNTVRTQIRILLERAGVRRMAALVDFLRATS